MDELQGWGIGTALATEVVQRARADRLTHVTATTLWENRPAGALLRHLGFRVRTSDCNEIKLLLELGRQVEAQSSRPK